MKTLTLKEKLTTALMLSASLAMSIAFIMLVQSWSV